MSRRSFLIPLCLSGSVLGLGSGAVTAEDAAPVVATGGEAEAPAYLPPADWRELLKVDEPMRRFFAERVDRRAPDREILQQIVNAVVTPTGLGFGYAADALYDAREAFRRRRGGCVTFALLVAAVARDYGLAVQFQEMDTVAGWGQFDGIAAAVRHTNLRFEDEPQVFVVDLRPELRRGDRVSDDRYIVPDRRAFAHFYSTAGFFQLVRGDNAAALRFLTLGSECDPSSAIVWANLGQFHARVGNLTQARECLEKSLHRDRRGDRVWDCLVNVLRRQGGKENLQLAEKYERRAQAIRARNPYFHYELAIAAREAGDWKAVEAHLQAALRLKVDELLFHELRVEALRRLGRLQEARRAEARLVVLRTELGAAGP